MSVNTQLFNQYNAYLKVAANIEKAKANNDEQQAKALEAKLGTVIFSQNPEAKSEQYAQGKSDFSKVFTQTFDANGDGKVSLIEYTMKKLALLDKDYEKEYTKLVNEKKLNEIEIFNELDKKFGNKKIGNTTLGNISRKEMLMAQRFDANNDGDLANEAAPMAGFLDELDQKVDGQIDFSKSHGELTKVLEGMHKGEAKGNLSEERIAQFVDARNRVLTQENPNEQDTQMVKQETLAVQAGLRESLGITPQNQGGAFNPTWGGVDYGNYAANLSQYYGNAVPGLGIALGTGLPVWTVNGQNTGMQTGANGQPATNAQNFNPYSVYNSNPGYSKNGVMLSNIFASLAGTATGIGVTGMGFNGNYSLNQNLVSTLGFGALTFVPLMLMPSIYGLKGK